MEIREEHKKTEVGVLPKGWSLSYISDIAEVMGGGTPSTYNNDYWNGQINWFTPTEVNEPKYYYESERKISTEGLKNCSAKLLPVDSILLTSRAVIGNVGILKIESCTNQGFQSLIPKNNVSNEFVYYLVHTLKPIFLRLASGSTFLEISPQKIKKIQIALPPLPEQKAIAEVLSDTDNLIQALEKQIAKKRLIKQGVMQELLRPKEWWEKKKLGSVAILKARIGWQGLTTAEYKDSGDYFLITGTEFKNGFIDWENCHFVEEDRYQQDKNIQIKEHDVLVTKDGTIGKVALIKRLIKPATLNSGVFVVRPINGSFYPEFFYYLLLSEVFIRFLSQLTAGSTINHLYQKDFVSFEFFSPNNLDEQVRIATILSDMDSGISALENKLIKQKSIKMGLMQQLLTGKIRLL